MADTTAGELAGSLEDDGHTVEIRKDWLIVVTDVNGRLSALSDLPLNWKVSAMVDKDYTDGTEIHLTQ